MQRFSLYGVHKHDYQESVTIGQTDARTHARTHRQTPDKVIPMCRYASQATQKWYGVKGLVTRNTHVKYESPASYMSIVMTKVKVFEK